MKTNLRLNLLMLFFVFLNIKAYCDFCKPVNSYPNNDSYCSFECSSAPTHNGSDYPSSVGNDVRAILDGNVIYSMEASGFGSLNPSTNGGVIIIKHKDNQENYFYAVYGHVNRNISDNISGTPVEYVTKGQIIGTIRSFYNGSSFLPHLHFGIYNGNNFPSSGWGYSSDHTYWKEPVTFLQNNCGNYVSCISSNSSIITVTYPNGGETLKKGTDYTITWTSSNISGNVKVEVYKGSSMVKQLAANDPNDGSCPFNPPSDLTDGSDYKIAVSAVDESANGFSGSYFSIVTNTPPTKTITVTYPNGGETLKKGTEYTITWTSQNISGNVKVEVYKGNLMVKQLAANDPNDGSCAFNPPSDLTDGSDYKIAVSAVDESANGFSGSYFSIVTNTPPTKTITVTYPNGGETLKKGTEYTITWTSQNISGNVKVEVYKGNLMVKQLAANDPNDGSCPFNPPTDLTDGSDYKIAVSAVDESANGFSGSYFSIGSEPNPINYGENCYGFTSSGLLYVAKKMVEEVQGISVKVGFWHYGDGQWYEKDMTMQGDFYVYNSNDTYNDYRDYCFHVYLSNSDIWLPTALMDKIVNQQEIKSNGNGGYNFYSMPTLNIPLIACSEPVSVSNTNQINYFVFPNPAKNLINISIPFSNNSFLIQLFDITGSIVFNKKLYGNYPINLSDLNSGLYIIKILFDNNIYYEKLIIEK